MLSALFIAADLAIAALVICIASPEDRARLGRLTRLGWGRLQGSGR
jgi:hypothetical protein